MNGIESDESLILPREKEKRRKIILNIKIFLSLLCSNALTLFLCFPQEQMDSVRESIPREGFQLVELPLKNFTRTSGVARATLFRGKEVVLHDVAVHHHLSGSGSSSHYLLEVSEKDLKKLVQYKGQILSAFPYGDYPFKKDRKFSHEIRF